MFKRLALLVFKLAPLFAAYAQTNTGIKGTITDASGTYALASPRDMSRAVVHACQFLCTRCAGSAVFAAA